MIMSILDTALFATPVPATLGVGFHNVGSGVLRASNEALVKQVERHYGERCGHLPLDAGNVRVLVVQHTTDIRTQMDYLSRLFGKAITPRTLDELRAENEKLAGPAPLVVPYINVPETEIHMRDALGAQPWGLPGNITHALKNKARIVISRYIDLADSPGMSVVIINGQVESLGWNSQLQKKGSKACIGTSTYLPRNPHLQRMQQQYEEQTAAFFETFLRMTARKYGVDFASIRGVANVDIMIPGELEQKLQRVRKQPVANYLAECNPSWTNSNVDIMN